MELATLFHHRWAVPVLAELHDSGARFATLQHRLQASRGALRAAIEHLIATGWIARNPGYGHPMRPEYVLTPRGLEVAPACLRLWRVLSRLGLEQVGLRKWALRTVLAVRGARRFNEIKAALPGITARALTLALKALQGAGVVRREIAPGYPPHSRYHLTGVGRTLTDALGPAAQS